MKIKYETIEHNLEIYKNAKSIFPIIGQYESGDINRQAMVNVGLNDFASFYDFIENCSKLGYQPIMDISKWRQLKPHIVEHTTSPKQKASINRKTEEKFKEIMNNQNSFDLLINGSWEKKPRMRKNGRLGYGRRKEERTEGIDTAIVPIINWAIKNEIEINDEFIYQDRINHPVQFYTYKKLKFDQSRETEFNVTHQIFKNIEKNIEDVVDDIRKMNIDYLLSCINEKFKKVMTIPNGTTLKCKEDKYSGTKRLLTKDKTYTSTKSYISDGHLKVLIKDDTEFLNHYNFNLFEDIVKKREDLLDFLLKSPD